MISLVWNLYENNRFYIIIIEIILTISVIFYECLHKFTFIENIIWNNKSFTNKLSIEYYDYLFNSIEYDYYNLCFIYNKSYNSIKIKHKSYRKNSYHSIICIFGILVNEKGLEIADSMLQWLLPEYDVYCVYQKYPGTLYEYPALRFAQWFSLMFNISVVLYVHTKGAFNQNKGQAKIRTIWRHEFTKPRKDIYIQLLEKNIFDIVLPIRKGRCTWFNGMFISKRAFNLTDNIQYENNRWHYEGLFASKYPSIPIRFKGILKDKASPKEAIFYSKHYGNIFNKIRMDNKSRNIKDLIILIGLSLTCICLKLLYHFKKNIITKLKLIIKFVFIIKK